MQLPDAKKTQGAYTLVEIAVVISILCILIAILLPVLSSARSSAKNTTCRSNLSQLGKALGLYAVDYDDWAPPYVTFWHTDRNDSSAQHWKQCLMLYKAANDQFYCPFDGFARTRDRIVFMRSNHLETSYDHTLNVLEIFHLGGQGSASFSMTGSANPATDPYCTDGQVGIEETAYGRRGRTAHGLGVSNVLYFDGHVKWLDMGWQ